MKKRDYSFIVVESFEPINTDGRHGPVHVRPLPDQEPYSHLMSVACPDAMKTDFDLHTTFRIRAKIVYKENEAPYVYTHYTWKPEVIPRGKAIELAKRYPSDEK